MPIGKQGFQKGNKIALGIKWSDERKEKLRKALTGFKHSVATKLKMSAAQKGKTSPMKGKTHSNKTKLLWSINRKGKNTGIQNFNWKGDKVGYWGLHQWISRTFGKASGYGCMICAGTKGSDKIEWANISGEYKREADDWTTLCKSCHTSLDNLRIKEGLTLY